ncbi:MAG: DUF5615 family PIN-like protein [Candidatus Hydrogenedentes bacterium]|nr:DUF5615 family PIN-like protein [Candidatus Hydrogenedentota bacterium]
MRIHADESFPGDAVASLRARGHDVRWVRTDSPGVSDTEILRQAQEDKRLIVTFDKDFGELAFRHHLPSDCGVVLFRMLMNSPDDPVRLIVDTLDSRDDWHGHFSVVETDRVRMRPLHPR